MKFKHMMMLTVITASSLTLSAGAMEVGDEDEASKVNPLTTMASPLTAMPHELQELIFDELSGKDLENLSQTCKTIHNAVEKDEYWRQRGMKEYGEPFVKYTEKYGNQRTHKDHYYTYLKRELEQAEEAYKFNPHAQHMGVFDYNSIKYSASLNSYRKNHAPKTRDNYNKKNMLETLTKFSQDGYGSDWIHETRKSNLKAKKKKKDQKKKREQ